MIADDVEDVDAMVEVANATDETDAVHATDDAEAAGDREWAAAKAHRAGCGEYLPTAVKLAGAWRAARERGARQRHFRTCALRWRRRTRRHAFARIGERNGDRLALLSNAKAKERSTLRAI